MKDWVPSGAKQICTAKEKSYILLLWSLLKVIGKATRHQAEEWTERIGREKTRAGKDRGRGKQKSTTTTLTATLTAITADFKSVVALAVRTKLHPECEHLNWQWLEELEICYRKKPVIVIIVHLCVWLCLSVCACKGLSLVVVGSWRGEVATTPTSPNQPTSPDTNLHYWLHQADREPGLLGPGAVPEHPRVKEGDPSGQLSRDPGIGRPRPFPTQKAANRLLQEVSWTVLHPHSWLFSSSVTSNQHWGVRWTLCTQLQDLGPHLKNCA